MKQIQEMSREELEALYQESKKAYEDAKALNLKLDMSRGKPASDQLKLTEAMLTILKEDSDLFGTDGTDCRNYGILDGIPEAKELFSKMLGLKAENILVGGASSLNLMYDTLSTAYIFGVRGETPWKDLEKVKFLCPVPGYDRHFAITEALGIEMINIPMNSDGPDMDLVEKLVSEDAAIKGIWCVPYYANPSGVTYSDATVRRFANLKPAAKDFRIYWDNAYCIHHLCDNPVAQLNLMDAAKEAGNENLPFMFASTSKITYPGAGVAVIGASKENLDDFRKYMKVRTIGFDKLNQLRHVKFFGSFEGMQEHMKKHAAIIKPKFDVVLETLEKELKPLGIGSWEKPAGGYFIGFDGPVNSAKRIVSLCKEAGLVLTGAGATYPYGKDPEDKNIRIAPTYPTAEEMGKAIALFCVCAKLVACELALEK